MVNNVILDTNIIRLLLQEQDDLLADYYWDVIKNAQWLIPFIVYGELYAWVYQSNLSENKIKKLNRFLEKKAVLIDFETDVACKYGMVIYHLNNKVKSTKKYQNDAWIAACAIHNDVLLITHDKNFECFLPLINLYPRYNIDIT